MKSKKHRLFMFSSAGDTTLATWEVGDVEAEEFARGIWEEAREKGWGLACATEEGAVGLQRFDPKVAEQFILRPAAGG